MGVTLLFFFSDLKPNNIVLTADGHVRLIDFGLAKSHRFQRLQILPHQIAHYSSPEVWNEQPAGLASDWFPYGVIITYLFQLRLPFEGDNIQVIRRRAQSGQPNLDDMPSEYPDSIKKFIKKLLAVEPADRLKQVSSDEFFGLNGDGVTPFPFKPGKIKIPEYTSSKAPIYTTDDISFYERLEGRALRLPSSEFLESKYFESL